MFEKNNYKLKIAQVIDVYENSTNGGAISTQRFTKLLREDGNRVIVFSSGKPENDKVVLKEFYPPLSYLKKIMQRMKFVFAVPDRILFEKIFKEVDVVHNQYPLWLGIVAINVARRMKKPIVSTYHVQGEQLMHNGGFRHPFFINLTYKIFMHFIYNKSDIVICPSAFAENELKKYGLKSKTIIISNGITQDYKPMVIPKKYPEKFTILSVGRNAVEKRQELLIRAIAASKYKEQIQLIILGDGPLRNKLELLSDKLLVNKTEFRLLPTDKIIEYYNATDLFVHTANIEVECMTALEAMACGLPLLIADADLSATKQFALNEKFLFKTTNELISQIEYWFENRKELQQSKIDYLALSEKYKIEDSYKKLVQTYYTALEMQYEKIPFTAEQMQLS